jgi:hypothetical protein
VGRSAYFPSQRCNRCTVGAWGSGGRRARLGGAPVELVGDCWGTNHQRLHGRMNGDDSMVDSSRKAAKLPWANLESLSLDLHEEAALQDDKALIAELMCMRGTLSHIILDT